MTTRYLPLIFRGESLRNPALFLSSRLMPVIVSALLPRNFFSMAWRSHGVDNPDLVQALKQHGLVKSSRVEEAMRKVDRANYCKKEPYRDSPQVKFKKKLNCITVP
jgi:hypothetical protein